MCDSRVWGWFFIRTHPPGLGGLRPRVRAPLSVTLAQVRPPPRLGVVGRLVLTSGCGSSGSWPFSGTTDLFSSSRLRREGAVGPSSSLWYVYLVAGRG